MRHEDECYFCHQKVACVIEAHWTVFDYDYIQVCKSHWTAGWQALARRTVEGEKPRMHTHWYDDMMVTP